jgi:hypothetical protein
MEKIMDNETMVKILVLSDNHTGSSTGLLPPHAFDFDGEVLTAHPMNKMQKWLWRNYTSDLTEIGQVDVILDLGDNIEGSQTKIAGRTLMDTDIDVQKAWSQDCLQTAIDLCKPKYFIGVTGTNYHIRIGGNCNADIGIYKALEAKNPTVKFTYADNLVVKLGQLVWSIAHPYPTTQFKTPPIEKLIAQHAEEYYYGNTPKINVFARGHAHAHIWERLRDGAYGFVAPCQQPTSAYGREKAYMTVRHPDIGILGITQENHDLTPKPLLHHWRPS